MNRVRLLLVVCLLFGMAFPLAAEEPATPRVLKERPRVFLGPYNDRAIKHYYYGYPRMAYYSHLYSPLDSYGPMIPGRSSVSFAAGSDGYMGASFSTTQQIRGTNLLFSLNSRWEEGDAWYLPGYRYSQNIISPRFSWSNENTFISVGVDVGEYKFSKKDRNRMEQPRVVQMNTSPLLDTHEAFSYQTEIESFNVTLGHKLGNLGEIFLSAYQDDNGHDSLSAGVRRRIYEHRNGQGEWFPPLR
ncbi:MAG: hypothetical protein P8L44_21650 [Opitutales bacterium]|nr:hypothetical protein [Opitutales bacterium]